MIEQSKESTISQNAKSIAASLAARMESLKKHLDQVAPGGCKDGIHQNRTIENMVDAMFRLCKSGERHVIAETIARHNTAVTMLMGMPYATRRADPIDVSPSSADVLPHA